MLHGSESWGSEMRRLQRNDCAMILWICGIKDRDETPSASLLLKLGIDDISSVLRCQRVRLYGHVQWVTSCMKSNTNFPLPGTRKIGRPRKTWSECVKTNINKCGLASVNPLAKMLGELVFGIAWCCQPHLLRHGQPLNLKWIWMNGWMDGWMEALSKPWHGVKWLCVVFNGGCKY